MARVETAGDTVEGAAGAGPAGSILSVRNLEVVYNDVVLVLRGVSLDVPEGSIVALLGANGAGKTTTLRAITGLLVPHDGEITKGRIEIAGHDVTGGDAASDGADDRGHRAVRARSGT